MSNHVQATQIFEINLNAHLDKNSNNNIKTYFKKEGKIKWNNGGKKYAKNNKINSQINKKK